MSVLRETLAKLWIKSTVQVHQLVLFKCHVVTAGLCRLQPWNFCGVSDHLLLPGGSTSYLESIFWPFSLIKDWRRDQRWLAGLVDISSICTLCTQLGPVSEPGVTRRLCRDGWGLSPSLHQKDTVPQCQDQDENLVVRPPSSPTLYCSEMIAGAVNQKSWVFFKKSIMGIFEKI